MRHDEDGTAALTLQDDASGEEELLFKLTAESFPCTVIVYDAELRIRFVNSAGVSRAKFARQELLGRTDEELYDRETTDAYMPALRLALETGVPQTVDLARYTEECFVAVYAQFIPVRDSSGRVSRVISIAHDISDRKRSELLGDAMSRINAAVNSTLDFEEIIDRAVEDSSEAIGADTAIITLREGDHWLVQCVWGAPQSIRGSRVSGRSALVTEMVAAAGDIIAISDASQDARLDQEVIAHHGIRSILAIPLIVREEVIGALVFRYKRRHMHFRQSEMDFARRLGASMSMALQNARLFEDLNAAYQLQKEISRTLQRALVPSLPDLRGGYRASALYVPHPSGQIGGDFLDVFNTDAGWIGLLIGDVCGKGIPAASLASSARNTVKAFAYEIPSPGRALRHANSVLFGAETTDFFATAFLALIDPATGAVRYSGAGHPPPAVCRPDGRIDLLRSDNPPLAFTGRMDFAEAEDRVEPGSRIIFYTDGLSEARRGGGFFGVEGIIETLARHGGLGRDELARLLMDAAHGESSGQPADDTAIIVLDCGAGA